MNKRINGRLAVGMAVVLGTELIDEALEPTLATMVHVPDEDFSPFGMPSRQMFMASGQHSIPNTMTANRSFLPTVAGEWNDPNRH